MSSGAPEGADLRAELERLRARVVELESAAADQSPGPPGLLAAVLDTSVAAVTVLSPDGRILYANESAEGILGLRASEIVERRYDDPEWRTTAPDGGAWPDEANPFVRVMSTGEPVDDVRHAIEWPDGQRKQLSINGAPIRNAAGEIEQLVFSITDVTEQHQQQERLRESNAWLNLALEAGGMGLWSYRVETGYVRWSEEVAALFGLRHGQFEGTLEAYKALVHPGDLPAVEAALEAALAEAPSSYEVAHRLVRPGGEVRWLEARGRSLCGADGRPTEILGTVVDVTRQKEIELALRSSDEAFRTLLETVPSYIVSLGRDRRIRMLNRARPPGRVEDLIGLDVTGFLSDGLREEYLAALERAFETGKLQEFEVLSAEADRDPESYLIRMGPVRKDGEVDSVTVVAIDTTRLKVAEAALQESEEQLRHAQRLESVCRLAGGVAHDFNNLLTVVIACAASLREELADRPSSLPAVRSILDASERGAGLTRQLLAFARKQVVEPRVLDLGESIRSADPLLRRLVGERVVLELELADDLWSVELDPSQFEQVLVNLAVNAKDAMPRGGRVCVRTENVPGVRGRGDDDRVRVTVEDEGSGLRPEDLERIFEPFFTTKDPGRGTGLGLSTCFGIVHQAGGTLTANHRTGGGAVFQVQLPRCAGPAVAPEASPRPPASREPLAARVLLVEDDPEVRRVSEALLTAAGLSVRAVESGADALEAFAKETFDVLLTDVVMPGMTGPELAVALRVRRPQLPVILASGYADELAGLCDRIGPPVRLVQKPFGPGALQDAVRAVLEVSGTPLRPNA